MDCSETMELNVIAKIYNGFSEKFGIPRQSGLTDAESVIVFEPEYRNADALRGLGDYSHLWLIWHFSQFDRKGWSPTVRPPRLGGNTRMGVFATRSPNRPNAIGLSSVEIESIEYSADRGPLIHVRGADLLDGTPIFDIKPYLPFTDSHPDARGGFADEKKDYALTVSDPDNLLNVLSEEDRAAVTEVLSEDPRPSYQSDPDREYGMEYGKWEIRFIVNDARGTLVVTEIQKRTI